MSISLMSAVFRLDIPPTQKFVLLAFADACNEEGLTWIPVQRKTEVIGKNGLPKLDLTLKTGYGRRAVQMAIGWLVEHGYITRDDRPGKGTSWHISVPIQSVGNRGAPNAPPDTPRNALTLLETNGRGAPVAPGGAPATPKSLLNHSSQKPTVSSNVAHAKPGLCPDDFWPVASQGTVTLAKMEALTADELTEEVEAFVAYHQARDNKYHWQKAWVTWVKNRQQFNGGNTNGSGRTAQPGMGGFGAFSNRSRTEDALAEAIAELNGSAR